VDRHDAYRLLSEVLESFRTRPFDEVASLVGTRTSERVFGPSGQEILIDVVVERVGANEVRVVATADSPSTFRLERMEEAIIIQRHWEV